MKKRIICLLLTVALVASLTSCGSGKRSEQGADGMPAVAEQTEEKTSEIYANPDSSNVQELNRIFHENPEDGEAWLNDYLFGTRPSNDDQLTEPGDLEETEEPEKPESNTQPEELRELSDEEKVEALKKYFQETDFLESKDCAKTKVNNYVTLSGKKKDEIYAELTSPRKGLKTEHWMEIFNSLNKKTQKKVLKYAAQPVTEEPAADESQEHRQPNMAGQGYKWLVGRLEEKENRERIWSNLSKKTKAWLKDQFEGPEPPAPEGFSTLEIILMVVCALLVAMVATVFLLSNRRLNEMSARIDAERKKRNKQEQEQNRASAVRTAARKTVPGGMSQSLKKQYEESLTQVRRSAPASEPPVRYHRPKSAPPVNQPAEPVGKSVTPAATMGMSAAAATAHREATKSANGQASVRPMTPAAPPVPDNSKVLDGYYEVKAECVANARYGLNTGLTLEKRSTQPVDPPVPYVVYADRSVTLNMDFYRRVGGDYPNNDRAWSALMNPAVQIHNGFTIVSRRTGPVKTPADAAGKKILEIKRAHIGEDGKVTSNGEIILE